MSHGLGRRFAPDDRDRAFLLREVLPEEPKRDWRYWWQRGAQLDQGNTGTCVGHAWAHFIEDGPITHPGTIDPFAIYDEATHVDEWQGNEGDRNFGTSVRAGAKALQARGLVPEYRWAFTLEDVVLALLDKGPVVVGTDWHRSMSRPGPDAFVYPDGNVEGGHAYLLNGVSVSARKLRFKNSWGPSWGQNGHAWICFEDFEELLTVEGEACLAVEAKT